MSPTQARRKGASRTCLDLGRCLTLAGSAGLSSLKCPRGSQPCSRELSSASRAPRHLLPELVSGVPGAPPSPATWSPEGGTALCAIDRVALLQTLQWLPEVLPVSCQTLHERPLPPRASHHFPSCTSVQHRGPRCLQAQLQAFPLPGMLSLQAGRLHPPPHTPQPFLSVSSSARAAASCPTFFLSPCLPRSFSLALITI